MDTCFFSNIDFVTGFCARLSYTYASRYSYEEAYDKTLLHESYHLQKVVSKHLYINLEKSLKDIGIIQVIASITATNIAGIKFHEKHGFTEIARLNKLGFKMGSWQDEILLRKQINPFTISDKKVISYFY